MKITATLDVIAPLHLQEQDARRQAEKFFGTTDVEVVPFGDASRFDFSGWSWRMEWLATGEPVEREGPETLQPRPTPPFGPSGPNPGLTGYEIDGPDQRKHWWSR